MKTNNITYQHMKMTELIIMDILNKMMKWEC